MTCALTVYIAALLFESAAIGPMRLIAIVTAAAIAATVPPVYRWANQPERTTP